MHQPAQVQPDTNSSVSHPFLTFSEQETPDEKAKKLKEFLIKLSKQPEVTEYRSILRRAADAVREKRFGFTVKKIEAKLTEVFEEYFDGECFHYLEIDNLSELTKIPENNLLPVLEKMIAAGKVETEKRRRWQEFGKHYNILYRLTGAAR